jgi:flagellar biosynthesis/type III secretory pathway chaperone
MQPLKNQNASVRPSPAQLKNKDSAKQLSQMQKQMSLPYEDPDYTEMYKSEIVNITAVLKQFTLGNSEERRYLI